MSTTARRVNPGSRRQMSAQNSTPAWMKWSALLCALAILAGTVAFALYQKDLVALAAGQRVTRQDIVRRVTMNQIANPFNIPDPNDQNALQQALDQAGYYAVLNPLRMQEAERRGVATMVYEDEQYLKTLLQDVELSHLVMAGYEKYPDFDYQSLYYGMGEPGVSDQAYLESLLGLSAHTLYLDALNSSKISESEFNTFMKEAVVLGKLDKSVEEEAYGKITAEDRQAYYEANKSEKYTLLGLSHILRKTATQDAYGQMQEYPEEQVIEARAIIDQVYQQAQRGDDFAALAKQFTEDSNQDTGGSLGEPKSKADIMNTYVTPFNTTAAGMTTAGQISDVIKTQYGYHVIRLDSVTTQPFGDVEESISSEMTQERANKLKLGLLEKFDIKPDDLRSRMITQATTSGRGW